ncbi:hypothetical protein MANES_07G054622v8 [Manihot esculenta]|uniref:Uncharacterized protein n=1 Tax=Manihot esculenta TaxID=3983 RepID=A0ACB7HF55_MANES|nr:hypothetical protein MANES_07G054622v8 [Manihot esculenta]
METISYYLQNPSNPYFLHHNENLELVLASPALTESNYHSWARAMKMAIASKNKLRFIDRTLPTLAKTDPMFSTWECYNNTILSWLTKSLSPCIAQSILWLDKAVDVWNDLKDKFSQCDIIRILDLQEKNFTIDAIQTYINNDYGIRFLKDLNEQYAHVKSLIMIMEPLPFINKVFSSVVQQERQMISRVNIESKAFFNTRYILVGKGQSNGLINFCTYCDKFRHTIETCYKKHGYPPNFKFRNSNGSNVNVVNVAAV